MTRDFDRLRHGPFDLLVIGGGIYGAWTAYDAALRGLRVALVERSDWAAGSSSASSKLIHGGLRYLEHRRFGLVRKSLLERRLLWRLGGHRVRPLRFVLPVYSGGRVGRQRLKLGLWAYDRLAGGRQPVDRHRYLDREEMLRRYGFLNPLDLRCGFSYGDCLTDDARFALEIVDGADAAGAAVVNRARVVELLVAKSRAFGARVQDLETGTSVELRAEVTAICAGAWSAGLIDSVQPRELPRARLSKGVHLVLPALPADEAFLLISDSDGRVVFLIPWYGRTLLGTTDTDYRGDPDAARVDPSDVAYLLVQANQALRDAPWSESDIIGSFAGLRALPADFDGMASEVSREWSLEEPLKNLLNMVGGKYTSARVDASVIVDRAMHCLGRPVGRCLTGQRPFPWAPAEPLRTWARDVTARGLALGLDEETLASCRERYGSRVELLMDQIEARRELAQRIVPDAPFCLAEVAHSVRHEMALGLEDLLRRRIPLLLLAPPPPYRLREVADLAGELLGWSRERRRNELEPLTRGAASGAGQ